MDSSWSLDVPLFHLALMECSLTQSHECVILGWLYSMVCEGHKCLIVDFVSCADSSVYGDKAMDSPASLGL